MPVCKAQLSIVGLQIVWSVLEKVVNSISLNTALDIEINGERPTDSW